MADIFSKAKRSEIMSKISGKETKPEILVRKHLFAKGFRYRKNDKRLAGKPDIVLPKYKTAIFIHGCFWHHHEDCPKSTLPTTNQEFWENKIGKNVERDRKNQDSLKAQGWRVIVIWQCRIKNKNLFQKTLETLIETIKVEEKEVIVIDELSFPPLPRMLPDLDKIILPPNYSRR